MYIKMYLCFLVFLYFGVIQSYLDQKVFACHSTDYICFKRQYLSLRDHVLLGAKNFSIDTYEPYVFSYGDTRTCVRVSGIEESELVAIKFDSNVKELRFKWELPLKMQQILDTGVCQTPEHSINDIEPFTGVLHKFTGRGIIEVQFSFEIKKKEREHYLHLQDQNIDMVLDIPDYEGDKEQSAKEFENSEWAFKAAKHFEAAEFIAYPHTEKYRRFVKTIPLKSLIALYPGEEYQDLQFSYDDESYVKEICAYFV